jgi:hypothetical protein
MFLLFQITFIRTWIVNTNKVCNRSIIDNNKNKKALGKSEGLVKINGYNEAFIF